MRHSIILFTITLLALAGTTHAQPDSLWSKTFGEAQWNIIHSIIQTADEGYIVAGESGFSAGRQNILLVKTNADGDSIWSRSIGGEYEERCYSVIQTDDEDYILGGRTTTYGNGESDMWLVKTDTEGDTLWTRTFGGDQIDQCFSMIQTNDGGYALAGGTDTFGACRRDIWLVKVNADGDSLWSKTYGGEDRDCCNSIIQTSDGGYALAGYTYSFGAGGCNFWLVKTNTDGDSLWSRTYGGISVNYCNSILQTADGGYVLGGRASYIGAGSGDMWLVRTDANGDSLWSKTYGGRSSDRCNSILQTDDGGYILAGMTESFGSGGMDMWLVRIDDDGDSLWSCTFGGEEDDWCNTVIQTTDGGYALAGYTDSFGVWNRNYWLVKTGPDPVSVPPESFIHHPSSFILSPAYPNPFNSSTTIRYALPYPSHVSLQVYNPSGQQISTLFEGNQYPGTHTTTLPATNLPSGLYFVRLEAAGELFTQKVMLVR